MLGAIMAKRKAKQKFDARNRGDIDTFLEGWTDETIYIFPGHSELSGTFKGIDEARPWFTAFRQQFTCAIARDTPMRTTASPLSIFATAKQPSCRISSSI